MLKSKNVGELTTTSKSIKCLGQILNIWQCEWIGTKEEFHEHFIRSHNFIDVFQQLQVSSVPFLNDQLLSAMTLVRAFDSNFIFYYHSSPEKKMIYFLIFLLDADDQPTPGSYYYELMVKSPEENHCKVINYANSPEIRSSMIYWLLKLFFFSVSLQDEIRRKMFHTRRQYFSDKRRRIVCSNFVSIIKKTFTRWSHTFFISN